MSIKKFIEYILATSTKNSSNCAILENHANGAYRLSVCIPREDLGKVIGKNGQTANALRKIAHFHAQKFAKKKLVFSIVEKNSIPTK